MLRVPVDPRDNLTTVRNVPCVDRAFINERAVVAQYIHHGRLVVLHGEGNEILKTVGHVAIVTTGSNG